MNNMFLFLKRIFLFCIPFIVLVVIYIFSDPFMIINKYENYNYRFYIHKNRDFISTEMFIKNSKKYVYDSFIFGSSTALFISPSIWKNYINTTNKIFSLDASGENIVGIWSKIRYLKKNDHKIHFALVTLESNTFTRFINNVPIYMKHYKVYPSSWFQFQYGSFLNFLDLRFLVALIHYKTSNQFYPYMAEFLDTEPYYYDTITNEYYNTGIINELKQDSLNYYEKRKNKFPLRSGEYLEENSKINMEQIQMLNEIKEIFDENKTDYRIVVCPSYDQIAFNKKDLTVIQNIFNKENVFDFSGINEFTGVKSNFYDVTHFKKYVGKELLNVMYSNATVR